MRFNCDVCSALPVIDQRGIGRWLNSKDCVECMRFENENEHGARDHKYFMSRMSLTTLLLTILANFQSGREPIEDLTSAVAQRKDSNLEVRFDSPVWPGPVRTVQSVRLLFVVTATSLL
jgi:hypothetical protein